MPTGRVAVSIPHLVVTKGREKKKEIYVTGAVAQQRAWDGSGPGGGLLCHHRPLKVGGSNGENGPAGSESPSRKTGRAVFCSEIFHRVRSDEPLSLSGSGILIYPPADPGAYFGLYLAVMESDEGTRDAAKFVADTVEKIEAHDGLKAVLDDAAMAPLGGLARVIAAVMKANRDDYLLTHYHSGFSEDCFGLPADSAPPVHDFKLRNDRVSLTLRMCVQAGISPESS